MNTSETPQVMALDLADVENRMRAYANSNYPERPLKSDWADYWRCTEQDRHKHLEALLDDIPMDDPSDDHATED